MSRYTIQIRMELLSETIISSGHSIPGGEDISLRLDASGKPFLPGSTLKGLLRESMQNLLVWEQKEDDSRIAKLFGEEGHRTDDEQRLVFGMLRLETGGNDTVLRTFTKLTADRVAEKGSLRVVASLRRGSVLSGIVCCAAEDCEDVEQALRAIKWIGLHRNRGFGRVKVTTKAEIPEKKEPIASASCLYYRLRLEAPLTVGEQHGSAISADRRNYVETLRYLPGSALRGYVLSQLAMQEPEWFEAHRLQLLGDGVRFLNALPAVDGKPSIPTPAGFFEDKAQTRFYSVLKDDVIPGDKRAKLGAFCRFDAEDKTKLLHSSPKTSNSLRILRTGEKQVFNARTIAEGTELDGYILLEEPSLAGKISTQLQGCITLGADRFAGSGLCSVTALEPASAPHWDALAAAPGTTLYLMLLSPTVLCRNGEPCGMDEEILAKKLGVESVKIGRCATSVTEVQGFNRTLGVNLPALPMYAAGSVFCLHCSTAPSVEAMRGLEREGLGLRRSEGYGQVLFLNNYAAISSSEKCEAAQSSQLRQEAVLRRARASWILSNTGRLPSVENMKNGLSASQIGSIQALCEQAAFRGNASGLDEYFTNKAITPKQEKAFQGMQSLINEIVGRPLSETLGCPVSEDSFSLRMELLIDLMNLSRKGGKRS